MEAGAVTHGGLDALRDWGSRNRREFQVWVKDEGTAEAMVTTALRLANVARCIASL